MTEHFLGEHERNLLELNLFLEQSNQLTAENQQSLMRLLVIQDWLADLVTRAEKLAERVRVQTH
jgi:hypothetical protein